MRRQPPAPPVESHPARIIGASVQGPSHVENGTSCQDSHAIRTFQDRSFGITVADGLGSASASEVGSEVAVEAALDAMAGTDRAPLPTADTVQEAVKAARAAVLERASEREQDPAELASTLLLVLGDAERVAYAQVGDGAMVGRRMDELFFLAPLEDTEYSNVTVPLTSSRWRESLRVGEHPAVDAVSVMTDGCERSVLDTSEDGKSIHRPFFDPLFAFVEDLKDPAQGSLDLEQLLRSETFREHSGDDKTLVAATLTV